MEKGGSILSLDLVSSKMRIQAHNWNSGSYCFYEKELSKIWNCIYCLEPVGHLYCDHFGIAKRPHVAHELCCLEEGERGAAIVGAFVKLCSYCGTAIEMSNRDGRWRPYDENGSSHRCFDKKENRSEMK
jgi:hypothetical protein